MAEATAERRRLRLREQPARRRAATTPGRLRTFSSWIAVMTSFSFGLPPGVGVIGLPMSSTVGTSTRRQAKPTGRQVYALAHELCKRTGERFPPTRGAASELIERLRAENERGRDM